MRRGTDGTEFTSILTYNQGFQTVFFVAVFLLKRHQSTNANHAGLLPSPNSNCWQHTSGSSDRTTEHFLTNNHSDTHMLLIPIEKLKNGRDSFRTARKAHIIHKAKTLEPLGINRRDEL